MRNVGVSGLAAFALLTLGAFAQSGGMRGSGDSGGERPYNGNIFREDEMRQQLPPEGAGEYEVGIRLVRAQRYFEAIRHLEVAEGQRPNDAHIQYYLGYSHQMFGRSEAGAARDGEFKMALQSYRRALALNSSDRLTHQSLGILYLDMHDATEAAAEFTALETLCPAGCSEREALNKAMSARSPAAN